MHQPTGDIHLTCPPSAPLAGLVTRYTGYRMISAQPGVHRGLPSPTATLIITLDEPICLLGRPGAAERTFDALVGGLHDWPELVAYGHVQEGVQIDVTPLGVRALFGMPIGDVRGDSFELADVIGRRATRLRERLRCTQSWKERFAICDQMLSRWATTPRGVDVVALRALELMTARHGNLAIDQLADDVGFSRQHLTRRIREELGLSPKRLAQVIRFDRARRMIAPDQTTLGLARIAADCGYADHAHMSRAFREFAGCGPTELFEDPLRLVPIVQADRDVGRASLVA